MVVKVNKYKIKKMKHLLILRIIYYLKIQYKIDLVFVLINKFRINP